MIGKEKNVALNRYSLNELVEVFIVLSLGFGLFIYSSTSTIIDLSKNTATQTYGSYDFIFIIVYELIILTLIAYYLKYRHWSFKDFNLDFRFEMLGVAILLVITRLITGYFATWIITALGILHSETLNEPSIAFQSNIVSIALISIVNSIYEEVLLIGYFFKRFEKYHPALVILLSFILRASYHTYQGWANLPMVFSMALVFGIYYTKYRKLWPLIIAHGIGNVIQFLNIHYHWINL